MLLAAYRIERDLTLDPFMKSCNLRKEAGLRKRRRRRRQRRKGFVKAERERGEFMSLILQNLLLFSK